jgi:hypothetical protein
MNSTRWQGPAALCAVVLEEYASLSPQLRNRFLAASVFWLKDSGSPDSGLVARTRAVI